MATRRSLPSDTNPFPDWVSSSAGDLSLNFNAGPTVTSTGGGATTGIWYSASQPRQINSVLPPEFFFVAPAPSFHHDSSTAINFNTHETVGGLNIWQGERVNNASIVNANVSSSSVVATCHDCGNQAKKDCPHRRCRTCCKSRGYACSTHVKSTWVSAERRREKQVAGSTTSQSTSSVKRARLLAGGTSQTTSHTSTSNNNNNNNNTSARSFDASSSHQDPSFKESLPGQVRAPAVFKCVRVTAVDDGEDEYAYQAVVNIGGHVFKGFLYDQGADHEGRQQQQHHVFANMSELHLGGGTGKSGALSSPTGLDTSEMYGGGSGGGLLGGSNYGNPMN